MDNISLDSGQKMKNVSDRSVNLAPFNTTRTENSFNKAINLTKDSDVPLRER